MRGCGSDLRVLTASFDTQIGAFALKLCPATDVTTQSIPSPVPKQMKIAFDGCGVTHGCCGTLFAAGLREQTQVVRQKLEAIMLSPDLQKRRVRLNVVGLSRGGCAAIFLAQELCHISGTELSMVQIQHFLYATDRSGARAGFVPVRPGAWQLELEYSDRMLQ